MIKPLFLHKNVRNITIRVLWSAPDMVARPNGVLLWIGCQAKYLNKNFWYTSYYDSNVKEKLCLLGNYLKNALFLD